MRVLDVDLLARFHQGQHKSIIIKQHCQTGVAAATSAALMDRPLVKTRTGP
jgi:hypothetical protein